MNDRARDDVAERLDEAVSALRAHGIGRVHVLAWRDLDDDDAGGSEVHADEFMRRWADRGLDVLHRTSGAIGRPPTDRRHGYDVVRRGSRYSVFPRTVVAEISRRMGPYDALVEIWNGVPWFSPIWCRRPHVTVLHHVHGPMWDQVLPGPLAALGRALETRLAPPWYRRAATVTPSASTREELIELGFRPERVTAVPNGVDPRFTPAGERSAVPTLLAVGRLAPVKRFDRVIAAAAEARRRHPDLRLTIVGEGPERDRLERLVAEIGGSGWISLPGRVPDADLVAAYRSAWLVVSGSIAEGWGLSLTEGAACGAPAVATDIRGHRCSVVDGVSGRLVAPEMLGETIASVLADPVGLDELRQGALAWASTLSWDASALGVTEVLLAEVERERPTRR